MATAITQDTIPKQVEGMVLQKSPQGLVLAREDGWYLANVNQSAARIWQLIDGRHSVNDIANEICKATGEVFDAVLEDIKAVVGTLLQKHALVLLPQNIRRTPQIEAHVKHRMGRFYEHLSLPPQRNLKAIMQDTDSLLTFKNRSCVDDLSSRHIRELHFIRSVEQVAPGNCTFSLLLRFHDNCFGYDDVPSFGFFRPRLNDRVILWPCFSHTTVDAPMFGRDIAKFDRPWKKKRDLAIWRGTTTGCIIETINQVNELMAGPIQFHDPITKQRIQQPSRLQLVARFIRDSEIDVGVSDTVQTNTAVKRYLIELGFMKDGLPPEQLLRYKYLIVVNGNSAASQLPWALHSNSVVLMVPSCWDSIIFGLKPWVHYVPLAVDFADLPEKLQWCRSHSMQCQNISNAASELMAGFYDEALEQSVQREILHRYIEFGY